MSKRSEDQLVTKKYLDKTLDKTLNKALAPFVTKKDLDNTIEKFAIMVGRGFADMQNQINDIHENMVTKNEFNFFKDRTECSFYSLSSDMRDVKGRLTNFEKIVEPIPAMVEEHKLWLRDHDTRLLKLENVVL